MQDDKNVEFSLMEYQENTTRKVNKIFNSGGRYNKLAGVVLPTGAGKSFVALEQMLSASDVDYHTAKRNGQINNSSMIYIAPTKEILSQVRTHILRHIVFNILNLENMSIRDINDLLEKDYNLKYKITEGAISDDASKSKKIDKILSMLSSKDIENLVYKSFPNLKMICYASAKGIEEKENNNSERITNDDAKKVPIDNSRRNKHERITENDKKNAKLIILDESHKSVTSDYGNDIANLISKNENGKILAITATPERPDNVPVMETLAQAVYGKNEPFSSKDYMAEEIYVMDAIRDGLVSAPDVVHFDYSLAFSNKYETVLYKYNTAVKAKDAQNIKAYRKVLDNMDKLIGFSRREFEEHKEIDKKNNNSNLEQADNKKLDELIGRRLKETIDNPLGKYIAFIPPNPDTKKQTTKEYLDSQKARIESQFAGLKDKNGKPIKIKVSFVTSDTKVQSDSKCSEVLRKFENDDEVALKILMSVGKLDEGVHVEGIDGCIMYKGVDTLRLYLQEAGRAISSMNPNKPYSAHTKAFIYDVAGNTFKRVNANDADKSSVTYDLERLQNIIGWIEKHGKLPEINKDFNEVSLNNEEIAKLNSSQVLDLKKARAEDEARLAISLKKIIEKYNAGVDTTPSTLHNIQKIDDLLNTQISNQKLRDICISERKIPPSEDELTGKNFLSLSENERKFNLLYEQAQTIAPTKTTDETKSINLVEILKILKKEDPNLYFHSGIFLDNRNDKSKKFKTTGVKNIYLHEYVSKKYANDASAYERIVASIKANTGIDIEKENYDIGERLAYIRGLAYTSESYYKTHGINPFETIDPKDIVDTGIIETLNPNDPKIMQTMKNLNEAFGLIGQDYNNNRGFLVKYYIDKFDQNNNRATHLANNFGMISSLEKINLLTGEFYDKNGFDAYGYDKDGFNIYGFDKCGFDRNHISLQTGTQIDRRGFYWNESAQKYLNKLTNSEIDLLGYDVMQIDKNGFEMPKGPVPVEGGYRYFVPQWRKKEADGSYSLYKYNTPFVFSNGQYSNEDCHHFSVSNTSSKSRYRLYRNLKGVYANIQGFLSNGVRNEHGNFEKPYDMPMPLDEFYSTPNPTLHGTCALPLSGMDTKPLRGTDIDGYDQFGFKEVVVNGKKLYINRDTSREYDKYGKVEIVENGVASLVEPDNLKNAKALLELLLGENGCSIDEFETAVRRKCKSPNINVHNAIHENIIPAFEIYQNAPNAFDREPNADKDTIRNIGRNTSKYSKEHKEKHNSFPGLDSYFKNPNNKNKIDYLFGICPEMRTILSYKCQEKRRRTLIRKSSRQYPQSNAEKEFLAEPIIDSNFLDI